ncbi:MAG: hypothetical protein B7X41_18085 [Microbacterium sp. 14-71-5]|nr:MAG: hypothetical protein B7X41_18085 [Microbacterium sp. 14-71-5]
MGGARRLECCNRIDGTECVSGIRADHVGENGGEYQYDQNHLADADQGVPWAAACLRDRHQFGAGS